MEAICLGEYFKLDYVELFSMKEDVRQGRKYCNHVNIYLSKQNVNILFYSLHQGLLFQCKCEPIIFILCVASIL